MNVRTVVLAVWVILLAHYGLLRIAVEFTFGLAVIFVGSVVLFGVYDAIRTRNDPRPGLRTARPHSRTAGEDEELAELRKLAGLNRREP